MSDAVNHPAHYTSSKAQCGCGKPIECMDFFEGFTRAAHHLIVGSAPPKGERFLRITVNKGSVA